ncbi:hypothetical protein RAS1_40870 [Phycisphaerae bacterium RAS1]|nr:hypothetical protein RAS1_40870 [Phycisphaerae bacterium RAS1]
MAVNCPRCRADNVDVAQFCARCGLSLQTEGGGPPGPGRVRHPQPLAAPEGAIRCRFACDLYFTFGSSWGGPLVLGCETIGLRLFNAGYDLTDVSVRIDALGDKGEAVISTTREIGLLPRGGEAVLELPSYDLSEPVREVTVALTGAKYPPAGGPSGDSPERT